MPDPTPHETEQRLADDYLAGAVLGRELAHEAMRQALEQAKAGTLRDPAKTAMNAAITSGTLLDKRLLLQERPTQRIEITNAVEEGIALLRRKGIAIPTTATDLESVPALPEPQSVPLLGESEAAKRARTCESSAADTPVD